MYFLILSIFLYEMSSPFIDPCSPSLQLQINRITQQIGTENGGLTPTDPDQLDLLDDLAGRQERIQKATYDLSIGRNK